LRLGPLPFPLKSTAPGRHTGPAPSFPTVPATPAQLAPALGVRKPAISPRGELLAAVEQVVPCWEDNTGNLLLDMPQHLMQACRAVRIEVGGALLPALLTQHLRLQPVAGTNQQHLLFGIQHYNCLVQGAELLPCRALMVKSYQSSRDGEGEGVLQQADRALPRFELVLRAWWPPAEPGQKVGPLLGTTARAHAVVGQGLRVTGLLMRQSLTNHDAGWHCCR
jgi:hypothetical protein